MLGKILSFGSRAIANNPVGGGRANIATADTARIGQTIEDIVPPLGGARTAQDLRNLVATGSGKESLGNAKDDVVKLIEARVGQIVVPSLSPKPMTLSQANEALTQIGLKGRYTNPLDQTAAGVDWRQLYGKVAQEISGALQQASPQAAASFQEAQRAYGGGNAILKRILSKQNIYQPVGDDLMLNTSQFQRVVGDPKTEAVLRQKLGPGWEAFADTVYRGGTPGTRDVLAPGTGRAMDALRQVYGRGQGGAPQVVGSLARTPAANIGSEYIGRQPYSFPPQLQAILDVMLQRGIGGMTEERRP